MRRSDIIFGILLVLSIIDFALAAPLLAQKKRHAYVDVVQIPEDVVTVVRKRGPEDEELQNLLKQLDDYVAEWPESSDSHAPSGSAPLRTDHGSMNNMQAPAQNPMPSNVPNFDWYYWTNLLSPPRPGLALPKESGQAYKNQVEHAQQPNLGPSTDPGFDWYYRTKLEGQPPLKRPKLEPSEEFGQARDDQVVHAQQPNLGPSTDPGFDWYYRAKLGNQPSLKRPKLESSKEFGRAHDDQVVRQETSQ
jgi:hypothetical protein